MEYGTEFGSLKCFLYLKNAASIPNVFETCKNLHDKSQYDFLSAIKFGRNKNINYLSVD